MQRNATQRNATQRNAMHPSLQFSHNLYAGAYTELSRHVGSSRQLVTSARHVTWRHIS